MSPQYDFAVVGGGIVGLATALRVHRRWPDARLTVLEKEPRWGAHQTGHNSGVIHSGVYYRPGSAKAELCIAGNRSMVAFCAEHDIPHDQCGKVIVATEPDELPRLDELERRGRANGAEVVRLDPAALRDIEPHARGIAALFVPSTGVVDFTKVCATYARLLGEAGADLRLGARVVDIRSSGTTKIVATTKDEVEAGYVISCAGLQSDRVARLDGTDPGSRIVPFRGEYYELVEHRRELVRSLIYPVPDPQFPFLGVHLTRGIDGSVHAGPNAVPGLRREGYRKRDVNLRDMAQVFGYGGFWRLAARNAGEGWREVVRSFSKKAFVRSLQRLVPEVTASDVVPTAAGVRAQALLSDGSLVDDFLIVEGERSMHVCNAPSPAATASLEIGRVVADRIPAQPHLREATPAGRLS